MSKKKCPNKSYENDRMCNFLEKDSVMVRKQDLKKDCVRVNIKRERMWLREEDERRQ